MPRLSNLARLLSEPGLDIHDDDPDLARAEQAMRRALEKRQMARLLMTEASHELAALYEAEARAHSDRAFDYATRAALRALGAERS